MAGMRYRFPDRLEIGAGIDEHAKTMGVFYAPAIVPRLQQGGVGYDAILMWRRVCFIHLISPENEISLQSFPSVTYVMHSFCVLLCKRGVVVLAFKSLE